MILSPRQSAAIANFAAILAAGNDAGRNDITGVGTLSAESIAVSEDTGLGCVSFYHGAYIESDGISGINFVDGFGDILQWDALNGGLTISQETDLVLQGGGIHDANFGDVYRNGALTAASLTMQTPGGSTYATLSYDNDLGLNITDALGNSVQIDSDNYGMQLNGMNLALSEGGIYDLQNGWVYIDGWLQAYDGLTVNSGVTSLDGGLSVSGTTSLESGGLTSDGACNFTIGGGNSGAELAMTISNLDIGELISIGDLIEVYTNVQIDNGLGVLGSSYFDNGQAYTDGVGNFTAQSVTADAFLSGNFIAAPGGSPYCNPFVFGGTTPETFVYVDNTFHYLRVGSQSSNVNGIAIELPTGTGSYQDAAAFNATSFSPSSGFDNQISLGVSGQRWKFIHVGTGLSQFDGAISLAPQSSAPSSPSEGTIYVDNSHNLKVYLNGAWKTVSVT